ncbi:hypothetical protein BCV70DRAFT_23245 [Testicularia cyperi]|uniref:Vacuolar protein-sorting-associated protein 36 n=1 Tax=Testicularia cyperi TaxID=1882483 RepID=A0A317Y0Y2_9BASI|nr:hypothetical protein BCV70DRAFT_23245 [Testicularia cyperi]
MDRFRQIDASNSSVGAILFHDEEVISLQDGIGLYDGKEKSPHQTNGTVYLTSHRLLYIDDLQPHRHSCSLELSLVRQSEYYAGFLKSSPKITLTLAEDESREDGDANVIGGGSGVSHAASEDPQRRSQSDGRPTTRDWRSTATAADSIAPTSQLNWICAICGFSNGASTHKCDLCGVTKEPTRSSPIKSLSAAAAAADSVSSSPVGSIPRASADPFGGAETSKPTPSLPPSKEGLACPVCTFLNHPSMNTCEMCGSSLARDWSSEAEPRISSASAPMTPVRKSTDTDAVSLASGLQTRSSTPGPSVQADFVKLSFRKGGDKPFYALLKSTLRAKAWSAATSQSRSNTLSTGPTTPQRNLGRTSASTPDLDGRGAAVRRVGIDGILSSVDTAARMQSSDMQGALKDLEALMAKAKQMVEFAEALNSKLTKQQQAAQAAREAGSPDAVTEPDEEAATLIRSSLVQLGLSAPAVTPDMVRTQEEYYRELARELAQLLLGSSSSSSSTPNLQAGLMGKGKIAPKGKGTDSLPSVAEDPAARGLIGLDEVWCIWNRVRGVALIPPQALRAAAVHLPEITSPSIRLKTFKTGLSVLHTPRYSDDAFAARILRFLDTLEWEHKMKRIELSSAAAGTNAAHDHRARIIDPGLYTDNLSPWGSGASTLEIAEHENIPLLLITEMMEMIESSTGLVVRDEGGPTGVRWFVNHFTR